jgi:hypothetical protein
MDKKLLALTVFFFVGFASFMGLFVVQGPLSSVTQASQNVVSEPRNAKLFAFPLSLPADGQTKSLINVFLQSEDGRPVRGKQVQLITSLGQTDQPLAMTNEVGQANFALSSNTPGIAEVSLVVDQVQYPQKVTIQFE